MTAIGPASLLLAEIRARASALRRQSASPGGSRPAGERPAAAGDGPPDLSGSVARALAAIAPDDPERHRKAFRAYLQATLAKELGIRRAEDPAFQALVDQVQDSMAFDPRIQRSMLEAGRLLLEGGGG